MDPGARPGGGGAPGQSREYKLVMLGAGGVGKSAMTMQFISHRFPEDHDPTIEDAYKIRIRIDDEPANLDILDTAGQAEFTAMRDQYMRAGEGFIICYSITDRRSFHEVREFKQLIYRVRRTDDTPVVLVGNKSDLTQLRQVSKEEGSALAGETFGAEWKQCVLGLGESIQRDREQNRERQRNKLLGSGFPIQGVHSFCRCPKRKILP
ncbi:GTP-binding protein Rit1 isoform X2 [Anomalospiza imberbis]|uniref:GTP-binding protein Rit1 isoform X2 n=1 Tax=Anomalospiza imberbis TaxID=187417 RepID=UPI00358E3D23